MKKVLSIATLLIGLIISINASASNLNTLINQEIRKTINHLNATDDYYYFQLLDKKITYADINRDGKKDAVVGLMYCEKTSCHTTTNVFTVAAFLNTGRNNYEYMDSFTLGLNGGIKVVNGIIHATVLSYRDSDPSCCPSLRETVKLKASNGRLIETR